MRAHRWVAVLDVDGEAVVGRSEELWAAVDRIGRHAESYRDLAIALRATADEGGTGRAGLAADAFAALTDAVVTDLEAVPALLDEARQALIDHAVELDDLWIRSDEELALAAERRERRDQAEVALQDARESELDRLVTGVGVWPLDALIEAEREFRHRVEALDRSHRAHRALRDAEESLDADTARRLDDVTFPAREGLHGWLPLRSPARAALPLRSPARAALLARGSAAAWHTIEGVALDAGIQLDSPLGAARAGDCVEVGDDGTVTLHVGGPKGGALVVGRDLGPEVFEVALALLGGRLPEFRPFERAVDLPLAEFSTLIWAYGANFGFGEGPQLQVGGVNGAWESYLDGVSWSPQELRPLDALGLAVGVVAPNTLRGHLGGAGIQQVAGALTSSDRACGPTFDPSRSSPRRRRVSPVRAGGDR